MLQRRVGRCMESGALLAAWLLLFALARSPRPAAVLGVLGHPLAAMVAVLAALWLAPGLVLWRAAAGPGAKPALHAVPYSFGLGLAWLLAPCSVAMLTGARFGRLLLAVVALNGLLTAGHLLWCLFGAAPVPRTEDRRGPATWGSPSAWLLLATGLVAGRLVHLASWRADRFTYGGDEWALMRAARSFLDAGHVADPTEFDVWSLVLALVVRLSGQDVVDVYRAHLAPLLLVVAALAFLAVAEEVLRDRSAALLALGIQGLYALSEMYARGEGLGMALLVRISEDKYAALMLALPVAQAAFWRLLRTGALRMLAAFAALLVAATVLQPFAIAWLALTCGATFVAGSLTGLLPHRRLVGAAMAAGTVAAGVVAWKLRALRPGAYFVLHDPGWSFNATLLELSFRQVLILSLEKGWYMAHPWLLSHPLTIAALAGSLFLLPRFRRSLAAQWMLLGLWLPVLLTFNPLTAGLLGRLVTPWRLYRLLWVMPVALALAWGVRHGLPALQRRAALRWPRLSGAPATGALSALALVLAAAALWPRMDQSRDALRQRNRVVIRPAERAFLQGVADLARRTQMSGVVLTTEPLSLRLPAWTGRLAPLPGLEAVRNQDQDLLRAGEEFQAATAIGPAQLQLLRARGIRYVLLPTSAPVQGVMERLPAAFRPLLRSAELALYEWRPEGWGAPAQADAAEAAQAASGR